MKRFLFAIPLVVALFLTACQQPESIPLTSAESVVSQSELAVPPLQDEVVEQEDVAETDVEPEIEEQLALEPEDDNGESEVEPDSIVDIQLEAEALPTTGVIEGSMNYPAGGLPDDLEVCAGQIEDGNKMYCTSDWIEDEKYTYAFGYELELAPGVYQVMAERSSGGLIGWYSEFVLCGQAADCQDHTPIEVVVEAGERLENIDPADWY